MPYFPLEAFLAGTGPEIASNRYEDGVTER